MRLSGARVVHAHNLNPTLGWRALAAAREAGARVVLHLHQYRLVCAIGVCFTRGAECTRCHGRDTLPGVRLNCRGSLPEAVAYGASLALWQRRLAEQADAVIVPSAFARERLRELGAPLDWERVHVLAPPVREPSRPSRRRGRGRLRARGLAAGAGEGRRCRDRRLPGGGHAAGDRRRRPRARRSAKHEPAAQRCASSATWTTLSWRRCAPARRSRWCPRARPRPSAWRRPRRWRRACRWPPAGSARCRSWSTSRVWSPPGDAGALAQAIGRLAGDRAAGARGLRARPRPVRAGAGGGVAGVRSTTRRRQLGDGRKLRRAQPRPAKRPDHRHHRPGRLVPGGAAAGAGLPRHRPGARRAEPLARLHRAPARAASSWCAATCSIRARCARRSSRAGPREIYHLGGPSFVPASWEHPARGVERDRRLDGAACSRLVRELEPRHAGVRGGLRRDLRRGAGEPAARGHAVPSDDALRDREARRPPAGGSDARARRAVRVLGDRLQPRVRAPARAVRDAPDHARGGRDRARAARGADAGLARGGARLVVRRRHRARRLADAPAGAPRRLRPRQRRAAHGRGVRRRRRSRAWTSTPSATCASTPRSCAPRRARRASAIRRKARERLGWEPRGLLRGAGRAHGAGRPALAAGASAERVP